METEMDQNIFEDSAVNTQKDIILKTGHAIIAENVIYPEITTCPNNLAQQLLNHLVLPWTKKEKTDLI